MMQENQLARHAADPRQTRALGERWMVSGGTGVDEQCSAVQCGS